MLHACKSRKSAVNQQEIHSENSEVQNLSTENQGIEVKVIDARNLDGCKFLLEDTAGNKYQPYMGMPDDWMQAGKKYLIRFTINNEISGICMAGKIIDIEFVQEVEE